MEPLREEHLTAELTILELLTIAEHLTVPHTLGSPLFVPASLRQMGKRSSLFTHYINERERLFLRADTWMA